MKKCLQKILFLLISLLPLLATGCWNRRELSDLAIVVGIAIDKAPGDEKSQVLTQIVKTNAVKNAGEGGGGEPYWNLHLEGKDLLQTLRSATHLSNRKLYIAHNQFVIFGREAAEAGLNDYLDYFLRDHETRYTVWLLVAEDKAADILETPSQMDPIPAMNINQLMGIQGANSQTPQSNIFDFVTAYESPHTCAVVPMIHLAQQGDEEEVRIAGGAVFRRDKMIGSLDETETRGLLWVKGHVTSGVLVVSLDQETVSTEILHARTKQKVHEAKDGHLVVDLEVHMEGTLDNITADLSITNPELYHSLQDQVGKVVRQEMEQAIQKAKMLQADIFALGEYVERHHPQLWTKLEDHWPEVFQNVEFRIDVNTYLTNTGMLTNPIREEKTLQ